MVRVLDKLPLDKFVFDIGTVLTILGPIFTFKGQSEQKLFLTTPTFNMMTVVDTMSFVSTSYLVLLALLWMSLGTSSSCHVGKRVHFVDMMDDE